MDAAIEHLPHERLQTRRTPSEKSLFSTSHTMLFVWFWVLLSVCGKAVRQHFSAIKHVN